MDDCINSILTIACIAPQRNKQRHHHDDYRLVSDYDIMPSVIMSISSGRRAGGQAGGQAGRRAGGLRGSLGVIHRTRQR
jgi:hypothetical protein